MKNSNNLVSLAVIVSLCLFAGCAGTGGNGESEGPLEKAADDVREDYKDADARQEDPVDKLFAPLDDTVDAVNRDLNKEEERKYGDN